MITPRQKCMSDARTLEILQLRALTNPLKILRELLPDGQESGDLFASRNPLLIEDHGVTLFVDPKTGKWRDYAVDFERIGFVWLVAYICGAGFPDAARLLSEMCDRAEGRNS